MLKNFHIRSITNLAKRLTLLKLDYMKIKLPQTRPILGYHDFFGEELQDWINHTKMAPPRQSKMIPSAK